METNKLVLNMKTINLLQGGGFLLHGTLLLGAQVPHLSDRFHGLGSLSSQFLDFLEGLVERIPRQTDIGRVASVGSSLLDNVINPFEEKKKKKKKKKKLEI